MKKAILATVIALAAGTAMAVEVGVTATRDYSGDNRNFGGVTIGQSYGKLNATLGLERSDVGGNDQNRFSLVGGYDVAKLGQITVTPRVGVAYLDNQTGADGYAMTVGVGASVPVTKQVKLGVSVDRQYGQDRVQQFDGNRVTVGATYKF